MEASPSISPPPPSAAGRAAAKGPGGSRTRRIAVLFTDVVGSTRFFRSRGDAAGRRMLQHHLDLASRPIGQEKGVLVKTIGDSVMAYFDHPLNAVRAAVAIQKAFYGDNQGQGPENQIHVRIGIHYGHGIVEDKDIFGNVVNLAAKIMPLVDGDQIFITDAVHDAMGSDCPVAVEPLAPGEKALALGGISLYNLVWHESAATPADARGAFMEIRLCPALADKAFSDLWVRYTDRLHHIWPDRVLREEVEGGSLRVALRTVADAVNLAGELLVRFRKGMAQASGSVLIPVQLLIDQGAYRRDQPLALGRDGIDWRQLDPGTIHLTPAAQDGVTDIRKFPLRPVGDAGEKNGVKVLLTNLTHGKGQPVRFLYQTRPVGGGYARCFYCGDWRHRASACPSKGADPRADALTRMGYWPVERINRAFFAWLTAEPPVAMESLEGARREPPALTAYKCHLDLGFVHQLRFFMLLWGAAGEDWEAVRRITGSRGRGGPLWLALDCLRTGNLDQAEYLMDNARSRYGKDYRAHCLQGLVHMEKGQQEKAEADLARAEDYTHTEPQKIFTGLLRVRLLESFGETIRAEKAVRKLASRHSGCADVRFYALKYRLREGSDRRALGELTALIRQHRRFYLQAMMDTDLAPASDKIHRELGRLLEESQKAAQGRLPMAEAEIRRLQEIFGEDDDEAAREKALLAHAEERFRSGGYFGFLEACDTAKAIIARVQGIIQRRKRNAGRTLAELELRCTGLVGRARAFENPRAVERILADLARACEEVKVMNDLVRTEHPEIFTTLFSRADEVSEQLDRIARDLKRLADLREMRRFIASFAGKSLIFQGANALIGLVLLPLANHYLDFLLPVLHVSSFQLVVYQKVFLVLGGLTGVMLAVLSTIRSLYPGKAR